MLSVEDRKNRLEELLERVKRNRGKLPEERATGEIALEAEPSEDSLSTPAHLPVPSEPPPVEEPLAEAIPAEDEGIPIDLAQPAPAEPVEEEIAEVEPIEVDADEELMEPEPFEPEEEILEAEPIEVDADEELMEPEPFEPEEEILEAEPEPEPIESTPEPAPEPAPEPEPIEPVPIPESELEPQVVAESAEPEVRQYDATPTASGEVATIQGDRPREWTLDAVLKRAWKLGSPQ